MSEFDLHHPDPAAENAVDRLKMALATPNLLQAVHEFYATDSTFAGHTFDSLGSNPPDSITLEDLLAVTLLDVRWKPLAVRALLGDLTATVKDLLSAIDDTTTLWDDQGGQELTKANRLWKVIDNLPGVGPTKPGSTG